MEEKEAVDRVDSVVSFFRKHWGELYSVYDIAMNFIGKGGNNPPGTPPEDLKGGLFRDGDEKKIARIWTQLTKSEKEIIIGLLEYEFGNLDNPRHILILLWAVRQNNSWRTIITDLDQSSQKVGERDKTVNTEYKTFADASQPRGRALINNNRTTEKETGDIYTGGKEFSLSFIKEIIKLVRSETRKSDKSTENEKLQDGYAAAWRHMKALGLPGMPSKETMRWIDDTLRVPNIVAIYNRIGNSDRVRDINDRISREVASVQQRKEQRGPISNWFRSLL